MAISTCLFKRNCVATRRSKARVIAKCNYLSSRAKSRDAPCDLELVTRDSSTPLGMTGVAYQLQPKTYIELAAAMRAATGETGHGAFDLAYARKITPAIRATVNETRRISLRRKRQRMTAPLVCDSQIATSLLPLGSVR